MICCHCGRKKEKDDFRARPLVSGRLSYSAKCLRCQYDADKRRPKKKKDYAPLDGWTRDVDKLFFRMKLT